MHNAPGDSPRANTNPVVIKIKMSDSVVTLPPDSNQARGIAEYAIDFLAGKHAGPDDAVFRMVERFHLDSVACGVSALALGANAPTLLRREAREYRTADAKVGVPCFGSTVRVMPEKAVLANSSAGTNNQATNLMRGEPRGNSKVNASRNTKGNGRQQQSTNKKN